MQNNPYPKLVKAIDGPMKLWNQGKGGRKYKFDFDDLYAATANEVLEQVRDASSEGEHPSHSGVVHPWYFSFWVFEYKDGLQMIEQQRQYTTDWLDRLRDVAANDMSHSMD